MKGQTNKVSSSKQDISTKDLKDVDSNNLCEKLQ